MQADMKTPLTYNQYKTLYLKNGKIQLKKTDIMSALFNEDCLDIYLLPKYNLFIYSTVKNTSIRSLFKATSLHIIIATVSTPKKNYNCVCLNELMCIYV